MLSTDYLVIGCGIIGLTLAIEYKRRYPQDRVLIIDKEPGLGAHASGRNSGVLHAGFYYTADSLKAKLTSEGNRMLTEYCLEKNLRINRCGKLVVTKDSTELEVLAELLRRGRNYGIPLEEITVKEAVEIEPRVKTFEKALYSPTTASVDPLEILSSLEADARESGVEIMLDTCFLACRDNQINTSKGKISAGYVVNAAGLYADKIGLAYGFSRDYRIIPFKGLYLYSNEATGSVKTNIYPVPDLNNPFLGVHFTLTADNHVKVGPTAIPAFWREHYSGLSNFSLPEMLDIVQREARLFVSNAFGFRRLALSELSKYYKPKMVAMAGHLLAGVKSENYKVWGKPGIRAQLFNIRTNRLEMDFRYEGDDKSFHVLNAVSPAFTCSMSFSHYLTDRITEIRNR